MSKIEWCDRSDWNPVRGCTRISEGCRNCYAEAIAARFSGPGQPFEGFAERTPSGPRWTGKVALLPERLSLPLRWRKPAVIFPNSMFDLFHEDLTDDDIAHVVGVMVAAVHLRGHTFTPLTKRTARAARLLKTESFWCRANEWAGSEVMDRVDLLDWYSDDAWAMLDDYGPDTPPPGIWWGFSGEDQETVDQRWTDVEMLAASGWRQIWCSLEPMLGGVDLTRRIILGWLAGIVVGGEGGPKARPMHPDWVRSLRDQCAGGGVPFFFKQWGEFGPRYGAAKAKVVERVGKARAGRKLDGRTHDDLPWRRAA